MISVREEVSFARTELKSRGGVYFSAIMLCTWDNIHGPKILYVWTGAQKGKRACNTLLVRLHGLCMCHIWAEC